MTDAIAIDCCWLATCGDNAAELSGVLQLLAHLDAHELKLLFDTENHIYSEYCRNVTSGLGRQFIQSCVLNGRVEYYSSTLTQAQERALDKISFDPSDRPYLAVAAGHGSAPYLTTEEKHLDPQQAASIASACGVSVIDTAQALGLLT